MIGVNAPRHAHQSKDVHGKKSEIESEKHHPEAQLAQLLVHHAAGHLGQPVIDGRENRKHIGADEYIVNVSDDVVSVVHLPVDRNDAGENSVQAADHQQRDRADRIVHGRSQHRSSFPDGSHPGEHLHRGKDRDGHAARAEKAHRHV